jgi:integrase
MSFYENKVEHFGGALVLFQRNLSVAVPNSKSHRPPTWYMRLKIAGHTGHVTKSTKLTSYEDAYEFAKSELLRLQQAKRLGHSLEEYTFEQHWQDWFDRNSKNGKWKEQRRYWHEKYGARYFKPYFTNADGSSIRLNEITLQMLAGYWDWRITYWDTDRGQRLQAYNPKRRNAKTRTTNNAKAKPATKTLLMEQSALNQIFFDAAERGRLQKVFKLKAPVPDGKIKRRPGFHLDDEYPTLVRYLRSYRDCVGVFADTRLNAWHRMQRQQLYYFVLFLANSGLRVGEARELLWRDVKLDEPVEGSSEAVAEVYVSKHTKKGEARRVQTQPNANGYLKRWLEITPHKRSTDPVWFGQSGVDGKAEKFVDLNRSFQNFLRRVPVEGQEEGMLYDRDGEKRTLYSLRHTYATMRLEKGDVNIHDLALNMGCTVQQIERHYSHVLTAKRRAEITKVKKPVKRKDAPVVETGNDFAAEALRRYRAGELSEAAFFEIIRLK